MISFADEDPKGNFSGKENLSNQPYSQNQPKVPNRQYGQKQIASERAFSNYANRANVNFKGMMNLDLNEEQVIEIKQIMIDFQKEAIELRNQIQTKQLEMKELMLEPSLDMEKVRAKLEEISQFQVELKINTIERQTKLRELLTDEQLETFGKGFPMQKFNMGSGDFNKGYQSQVQGYRGDTGKGNRW